MTQHLTIVKVAGIAADAILLRIREWSAARTTDDPNWWASEQWPAAVHAQANQLSEHLRNNQGVSPLIHYVEWIDMWSMFDLFARWLTPPDGPLPFRICTNQLDIYAYALPDGARLKRHLAGADPQQFPESVWFVRRLAEAEEAREQLIDRAVLVVLRRVLSHSLLDEEFRDSLLILPGWLSETMK